MRELKPGTNESLGKAIHDYEVGSRAPFGVSGGSNDLHTSNIIVAAGKNAATPHYMANNQGMQNVSAIRIPETQAAQ